MIDTGSVPPCKYHKQTCVDEFRCVSRRFPHAYRCAQDLTFRLQCPPKRRSLLIASCVGSTLMPSTKPASRLSPQEAHLLCLSVCRYPRQLDFSAVLRDVLDGERSWCCRASDCDRLQFKHDCVVSMKSHASWMLSAKHSNNTLWSLCASCTGTPVLWMIRHSLWKTALLSSPSRLGGSTGVFCISPSRQCDSF